MDKRYAKHFFEIVAFTVILASFTGGALAQSSDVDAEEFAINGVDCDALVRHAPAADVAYQSRVGIDGEVVVPADLPDSDTLIIDPADVSVDPRIPLADYTVPPPALADGLVNAGEIRVRDGVVYLGDRPLTSDEQRALAAACVERNPARP